MKAKKRDYKNDFVSVTEVLSQIRKPALEEWFKTNTKKKCEEKSSKAKEIGKQIHEAIENYIVGENQDVITIYETEVNFALQSFLKFKEDFKGLNLIWAEREITSEKIKLNGTIDCVAKEKRKLILLDWKTGECKKKDKPEIYFEHMLQVCAYRRLWNMANPDEEICDAMIVVFAKDAISYNVQRLDAAELVEGYDVFSNLLDYYYQRKKMELYFKEKKIKELESKNLVLKHGLKSKGDLK